MEMDANRHKPRKRFGQHFLNDPEIIQKIVQAIHPKPEDALVEIGPGLGAITQPLLQQVDHLDVIELDRDLAKTIGDRVTTPHQLTVYQQDALKFDFQQLSRPQKKLRIIGNLPYNISTPLLFHLLKFAPLIQDMHFMLQKEIVDRITAKPNTKAYGRLTVMIQYFCETHSLFTVEPTAFKPPPKVNSAVIRLVPHTTLPYPALSQALLKEVTTQAFNQRRKTIHNALKPYLSSADFVTLSLNPILRPEELTVEDFVRISNYVAEKTH